MNWDLKRNGMQVSKVAECDSLNTSVLSEGLGAIVVFI